MEVRVMISQPMDGRSDGDILMERAELYQRAKEICAETGDEAVLVDSLFREDYSGRKSPGAAYLGRTIFELSGADLVIFGWGWEKSTACRIEHNVCTAYDIRHIDLY